MKKLAAVAVIVGAVALFAAAIRVVHIHGTYGEWRLTGTQMTPVRITALGRQYERGDLAPHSEAPSGLEPHGDTASGGTILVPKDLNGRDPVVIYVRDDEGQAWSYGLVGGP